VITQRRVPELIPILSSQPAGDVSHKPLSTDGNFGTCEKVAISIPTVT